MMTKGGPVVILYGEIGTRSLNEFHLKLKALAQAGEVTYVMRHFLKNRAGPKVRLSGKHIGMQKKIWKSVRPSLLDEN